MVLGLMFTTLTASFSTAAEEFSSWYQVDVIVFKPRQADITDENWPEISPSYPAETLAVTEGRVFRLSQLEGLAQLEPAGDQNLEELPAPRQQFAFEDRSNRARNQQIVDSLTGANTDQAALPSPDVTDNPSADDQAPPEPVSLTSQVADLLASLQTNTSGRLAFSDTRDASSLAGILRSLNRSSRFDVLTHLSWIQPVTSDPTPILIQAGARHDDQFEVEGTLSISRSRFLHVATDLWYTRFDRRSTGGNPLVAGYGVNLPEDVLEDYPDLVAVEQDRGQFYPVSQHAMQQSRRMRSNELHYMDHPLLGIVVQINRYTPPADEGTDITSR